MSLIRSARDRQTCFVKEACPHRESSPMWCRDQA